MNAQSKATLQQKSRLSRACLLAMIDLCDKDTCEGLPDPVFSAAFTRKIRKFTALARGNRYHRLTRTAKILIAAAILALLLSLSAVAAKQFGFSLINFGTDGLLKLDEMHKNITPLEFGYVPEGFTLEEESIDKKAIVAHAVFINSDNQHIIISKHGSYAEVSIDTENRSVYTVERNGIEYMIAASEEYNTIYWMDPANGVMYDIGSQLNAEVLLRIAEDCK